VIKSMCSSMATLTAAEPERCCPILAPPTPPPRSAVFVWIVKICVVLLYGVPMEAVQWCNVWCEMSCFFITRLGKIWGMDQRIYSRLIGEVIVL